jgi:death-on-curing protein
MTSLPIGRPRFVTSDEALAWHAIAVAQYGGDPGLRDRGLLESAIAQPRQSFGGEFANEYPFGMAAAYAYHIAKNHPFVDGNKRASLICAGAFLRMNGWDLVSEATEAADTVLGLVSDEVDKGSFAVWLAHHCRPRPSLELRDFFAGFTPTLDFSFIDASAAGGGSELNASCEDAARAIPVIAHLVQRSEELRTQGDELAAMALASRASVLVAIYRLAEDMGYEW